MAKVNTHDSTKLEELTFTNDWFKQTGKRNFELLLPQIQPKKILEIGSYEGASTCFLIEFLGKDFPFEIHCVDTWLGGQEHKEINMSEVEARFLKNTELAIQQVPNQVNLVRHKGYSDKILASLLASNQVDFDFIYVDGSHEAPDVIVDAILSFRLLKVGGVIGFDDYIWGMDNILFSPKIAIDSFVNIYSKKLRIVNLNLQIYLQKTSGNY